MNKECYFSNPLLVFPPLLCVGMFDVVSKWGARIEVDTRTNTLVKVTEVLDDAVEFIPWCVEPITFDVTSLHRSIVIVANNTGFLHNNGDHVLPIFNDYGMDFNRVIVWERKRLRKMFTALVNALEMYGSAVDLEKCEMTVSQSNPAVGLQVGRYSVKTHIQSFWTGA